MEKKNLKAQEMQNRREIEKDTTNLWVLIKMNKGAALDPYRC